MHLSFPSSIDDDFYNFIVDVSFTATIILAIIQDYLKERIFAIIYIYGYGRA